MMFNIRLLPVLCLLLVHNFTYADSVRLKTSASASDDGIMEVRLEIETDSNDPLRLMPEVTLERADASATPVATVNAFWDGGSTWKARFRMTQTGNYRYSVTLSSGTAKANASGTLNVTHAAANNALRVSAGGTHLETLGGEPFFWLADTGWNSVLRSTDEQWSKYLDVRQTQGFNVIQFVSTPWRGGRATLENPPFDLSGGRLVSANPESLAVMDRKIREINAHEMVASPIMLWALNADDPGEALSEQDAIFLATYLRARWGAYRVVWMLGGDGRYSDKDRWRRIGDAVFPESTRQGMMPQLATTHPSGLNWVGDAFADSKWLAFHGYQSGHGDSNSHIEKHLTGPWTQFPFAGKPRPVINLEPNYEAHPGYETKKLHTGQHVRRAAYWSLLLGPTAGVTYGHNAIWVWNHKPDQVAENHHFKVGAWSEGLQSEGLRSMTLMKHFFETSKWWTLRNANELVAKSNNGAKITETVVAARSSDGDWFVAYTPEARPIQFEKGTLRKLNNGIWFDPATGKEQPAKANGNTFTPPTDNQDWVLSVQSK